MPLLGCFGFFFLVLINCAFVFETNASPQGSIKASRDGNLIIDPPIGGSVVLKNFTELSLVQAELSVALDRHQSTDLLLTAVQANLSVALSRIDSTENEINATESIMSKTQAELSSALSRLSSLSSALFTSFMVSNSPIENIDSSFTYVGGDLIITNNKALTSASFPLLTRVYGSIKIALNPKLSNISFPLLSSLGTDHQDFVFLIIEDNALTYSVSFPYLNMSSLNYYRVVAESLNTSISRFLVSESSLVSIDSSFTYIEGDLVISNNNDLTSASFPLLTRVYGSIKITANPNLSKLAFPVLSSLGGDFVLLIVEENAVSVSVSFPFLNLSSLSYFHIAAPNLTCITIVPYFNCSAFIPASMMILGGDLGVEALLYTVPNPQWSNSTVPALSEVRYKYPAVGFCFNTKTVHIAGGTRFNNESNYLNSASMLPINTMQWTNANAMRTPRGLAAGVCLADGETFMVCGGQNDDGYLSSCELLDSNSGAWSYTAKNRSSSAGFAPAMVLFKNLPVVLGGFDGNGCVTSVEQYNPGAGSWSNLSKFSTARTQFGAAVVYQKIFITGGWNSISNSLGSVEVYNGTAWAHLTPALPAGTRNVGTAVSFQNKLVVLGGTKTQVDVYDPGSNSWLTFPSLSPSYGFLAAVSF